MPSVAVDVGPAGLEPLLPGRQQSPHRPQQERDAGAHLPGRRFGSSFRQVMTFICALGLAIGGLSYKGPSHQGSAFHSGAGSGLCQSMFGGHEAVTVLLVADPGDMTGAPENQVIKDQLQDRRELPPSPTGACASRFRGLLMGQPVVLVTTGIGAVASSSCMTDLLQCPGSIKEVVFSGTSGWSPQVGGVLNADDCSAAGKGDVAQVGDVCVTPFTINFDCHKSSWRDISQGYPNMCSEIHVDLDPSHSEIFGSCLNIGPTDLADEILSASRRLSSNNTGRGPSFPDPNSEAAKGTADFESAYWSQMSDGTGLSYELRDAPRIWNYSQCAEVNTNFFFSGSPFDAVARRFAAVAVNSAASALGLPFANRTQRDVLGVGEMEGEAFANVMVNYNKRASRAIPFVNVRGKSNHNMNPVIRSEEEPGLWLANPHEPPEDFDHGYPYAVQSCSAVVLSLFMERCTALGLSEETCRVH